MTWANYVQNPMSHPTWPDFLAACSRPPLSLNPEYTKKMWWLVIRGLDAQWNLKLNGHYNVTAPELLAFERMISFDVPTRERLLMPAGRPNVDRVALWSGGIEVSQRVRRDGYLTLENTPLGKVFDDLTNPTMRVWMGGGGWGPQGKLWNIISAQFVINVASRWDEISVFLRTHDYDSIFFREERTNWRAAKGIADNDPNDRIVYQVLVGAATFEELRRFQSEQQALQFLLGFLGLAQEQFNNPKGHPMQNHTYNSRVWMDNQRAFDDSIRAKSADMIDRYLCNPPADVVAAYEAAAQQLAGRDAAAANAFDPAQFARVMNDIKSRVS
ncbi:MAG: hypothetical protein VX589_00060 [Myxococcota bacterium]|nr:hypothetical protein [Myxococcota bacterium]